MAEDYVFGANILENLTTGMYQDSRIIYREYIQNACDQIDKAIQQGILIKGEEEIWIDLDPEKRTITITDNATGIGKNDFRRTLSNIADSDKKLGEDKGFRGIGRLCGLAYCSKLIFSSTAQGENVISKMTCDATKMRKMINENELGNKHTAVEILKSINEFSEEDTKETDGHWFKVELININSENTDLLDSKGIKDYLSFVAPVPYKNSFIFRKKIYEHAKELGVSIDEYTVKLNGEQIFKEYKTNYKISKGEDEIFDIEFKDLYDKNKQLIAWLWVGISQFKAIIESKCLMRGIRLRKENIQIGNEDTLQYLFKEERGLHYFIGEVFGMSRDLIPNAQRDYFNENPARKDFEHYLKDYFDEVLHKVYHDGSAINSAYKKRDDAKEKSDSFEKKKKDGYFVDKEHERKAEEELKKAKQEADKARQFLEKKQSSGESIIRKIINRKEKEREKEQNDFLPPVHDQLQDDQDTNKKQKHRTDELSAYSKNERKLIGRIYSIIMKSIDEQTATIIIDKIQEELKK